MINFEEYRLLESYIGSKNFEILLEKNLSNKIHKYFGKINLKDYIEKHQIFPVKSRRGPPRQQAPS